LPPRRRSAGLVGVDVVDCILDGEDLLGGIVGNLDAELLLECHHQLDDIKAVGAQIVDEARFFGDLVTFYAKMLDNNLFHALGSIAHGRPSRWGYPLPAA
jgi:hypothetical protein